MPVTAKLSKEFYDKFGHAVVDELVTWLNQVDATYRGDLRELNELNFARFDAKLEQRAAQLDAKLEQRTAQLDAKLEQRTAQLDAKLEQRTAQLEAKLEAGLARLEGGLLARIAMAEGRLARLTITLWVATLGTLIALLKL
jgi:hypothetical protein